MIFDDDDTTTTTTTTTKRSNRTHWTNRRANRTHAADRRPPTDDGRRTTDDGHPSRASHIHIQIHESPPGTTTPPRACSQCPMRHTVYPYTPDTHVHTRPRASSSRDRHSTTTMSAVLALNTAGLIPLRARASVARKNARAAVAPKVRTHTRTRTR